jgi:hypothetical protein
MVAAAATVTPQRLHGVVDHGQQLGAESVQVDLVA